MASAVGAAGAGVAVTVASCGGSGSKSSQVRTVSTIAAAGDAAVLNALLDQEHSSIAAYALIATHLSGSVLASVRHFAAQEHRHANALAGAIGHLGGTPNAPRPTAEYAQGFPTLRNARDALSFALDVETTAVAGYSDALGKIATDSVRTTAASILTTEAEHASVVLGDLGRPPVPQPFVTGPPPQQDSTP